jgi:hypothetical protein
MASVTFGGPDLQYRLYRFLERLAHSVFPRAGARPADGALERDAVGPHLADTATSRSSFRTTRHLDDIDRTASELVSQFVPIHRAHLCSRSETVLRLADLIA